ncbi:MAG: hypothetical protein HGB08_04945 [Candidatus Moranbacteria bacterium]|nr:hypothetical protein [Candidatus Moranbacteria bacterium]
MKNKINKSMKGLVFSLFAVFGMIFMPVSPALASLIGSLSATENMDDILGELGFDKTAIQDQAMIFNSARFKKPQPQVSLIFTPTDPIDGQRVIATATPMYFLNDMKDMYFTWFLKTKDCPKANKNGDNSGNYNSECDLNNDEKVDVEDWKIKAMRIYANNDFNWNGADYSSDNDDDGYQAIHGGDDQKWKNNFCYVHDTKTGWEFLMYNKDTQKAGCDDPEGHLFPNATNGKGSDKETIGTTGDGIFTASEEKFWHTSPDDSDTADTGHVDEANIAGLGANEFKWTYSSGDEIGVAVEGISVEPTKAADASYKIMWAMLNNKCDVIHASDTDDPTELHITGIDITDQTTSMTVQDLNDCLYDNMTTPSESTGQAGKLDVTVSQTPANPTNDSSGNGTGDKVSFVASLSDDVDSSYISYGWEVFEADKSNTDDWGDPLLKSEIPNATATSGIGTNTFSFKMDFDDPKPYMKVKVTATETMSDGETREGHDFAIFPISSTSEGIKAYAAKVSDNGKVSLDTSKEMCVDDDGNPISDCSVTKDQIIGLEFGSAGNYDNYSWTLNGEPITYKECFFEGCGGNTNKAFFPVVDNSGSSYNVQLIATKDTGEKVTLSKTFKITDPSLNIVSLDTSTCKAKNLGYFDNYDGTTTPVYSTVDFEAASGETIKLAPENIGSSLSNDQLEWYVDSALVSANDDGSIEFLGKNNGEYYNVSLYGHYVPDTNTIKALIQYWGVSYSEIYDKNLGKTISIRMTDSFSGQSEAALDRQKNKRLFATIASGIPAYLAFLVRIVLSVGLIIFTMRIIFSLSPSAQENDY